MLGMNRTDLNSTGTSYRNGTPVTLPVDFGTDITLPHEFGNPVPTSGTEQNVVTLPHEFGNIIGSTPPPSGVTIVASTAATNSNGTVTTDAIDTLGADFLVLVTYFSGATVSDNLGNTWTQAVVGDSCIWFVANPTVGVNHTFTVAVPGQNMSVAVAAFSGLSSDPFEVANGNSPSVGLTVQPVSVTPDSVGDLLITGLASQGLTSPSINDGFTVLDLTGVDSHSSATIAYLIAPSTSPIQPTWTVGSNTQEMNTDCAVFAHS